MAEIILYHTTCRYWCMQINHNFYYQANCIPQDLTSLFEMEIWLFNPISHMRPEPTLHSIAELPAEDRYPETGQPGQTALAQWDSGIDNKVAKMK